MRRRITPLSDSLLALSPMLLNERPIDFNMPGWLFEIQFDGYRVMAEFGDGKCQLKTRNGANASAWFAEITDSLAEVPGSPCIVDGEVCVLDEMGNSDFDRLHKRAHKRRFVPGGPPVVYCVFDLLVRHGVSIMDRPQRIRKTMLSKIFTPAPDSVVVVQHIEGQGDTLFHSAVMPHGLEGLVAKRDSSIYVTGSARATG